MRIVQLGKYFPPYFGGIERVTELSAKALGRDHEVTVICHSHMYHRSEEDHGSFRVIRCSTEAMPFRQPISIQMGRELRRLKPDLIHFHAPNFWGAAMIELFCPRVPLVVTHHADVEKRTLLKMFLKPLYWRLLRRAKRVFISSLRNAKYSRDLMPQLRTLKAIPFGLDHTKYQFSEEEIDTISTEREARFGNDVIFGFVGRLVWYKGLPVLLDSLARLQNCQLVIVGDGPLLGQLKAQSARLGIDRRVHFLGAVRDREKLRAIQIADIMVLPSTHITETFGLVQVEAQLCKKPVITTDLPTAVSEVTLHDVTGLIVRSGSIVDLTAAMEKLATDKRLRERLGVNGYNRATEHYIDNRYMDRLSAEINAVIDGLVEKPFRYERLGDTPAW
jgi:glycosyltransferase involved in cell wall biosynthesis